MSSVLSLHRHRLCIAQLHGVELGLVIGIELLDLASGQILQRAPVFATLLDQVDDCVGHLQLDQPLLIVGRVHERGFAQPLQDRKVDVILDQDAMGFGRELAELLREPGFVLGEVGRSQRHLRELGGAVFDIFDGGLGPVLVEIGIALKVEPVMQRGVDARVMHEHRVHAGFDREAGPPVSGRVGNAVLGLTGRVHVEHRRRRVWFR